MRQQVALRVGTATLLLVPMAALLGSVLHPKPRVELLGGRPVSPVLDIEERTSLQTYHRDCAHNSDCEPPLGCVVDPRSWVTYCTDSQCMADGQCPEGSVCRAVATRGEGPLVRFCIPLGPRKEGERCSQLPRKQDHACGPGLLCGGTKGWCGRPCQPKDTASCPRGSFCADVAPEPLCLPTCETEGCPAGQQCIRYEEGVSACAVVYGRNCQQSACSPEQKCQSLDGISVPGKVWMDCVQACGEGQPECPAGSVCSMGICSRTCEPESTGGCGADFRCKQLNLEKPSVCAPDW
jgi:hypothetical protein